MADVSTTPAPALLPVDHPARGPDNLFCSHPFMTKSIAQSRQRLHLRVWDDGSLRSTHSTPTTLCKPNRIDLEVPSRPKKSIVTAGLPVLEDA
jgi:hypothetical protein